jgi:tRNA (guanine37-N1)-methyltransferase
MDSLLEHPHYTRPAVWRGHAVPDVLLSGHHAKIQAWRRDASLKLTAQVRPDLLEKNSLNPQDRARIQQLLKEDELL